MPIWVQIIGAITGIVALLAALWSKVLRPGAKLISSTEEMLPLLREITNVFRGSPGIFMVLKEIADEFRSDSGSTLRDAINRIEQAAADNREAGEILKVEAGATRVLAERDRKQLDRLLVLIDRLAIRVDGIKVDSAGVAADLQTRHEMLDAKTEGIADDLSQAQRRADATNTGESGAGAAADAAALSPEDVEEDAEKDDEEDDVLLTSEEVSALWKRLERRISQSGTNLGRRSTDQIVPPLPPEKPS